MVLPSQNPADPPGLKILDFGLGCESCRGYGTIGTLGYMPPEVFGSERYGHGVDIFAAGVVMHILLTGAPPFQPPMHVRSLEDHLQSLHEGPNMKKKGLARTSTQGRDLLDWMLLPDPRARCNSGEALRHQWLNGKTNEDRDSPLWSTESSELRFLKVMGVWAGSSSSTACSTVVGGKSLNAIEEDESEEEEALLEDLICRLVRRMEVPVCMASPDKPDCPLVAVSDGFEELTGYKESDILGSNCRFLNRSRSEQISEETRKQLREASQGKRTFVGVLPNARSDGSTFENLLHLSPIDIRGRTFIVGVQMEVQSSDVELQDHEILGTARKVHTAIRHWLRSPCGTGRTLLRAKTLPSTPSTIKE
eukprot:TRINITY_DN31308_c1_g1_i1.p1 TRINITY_DN31308_c1_g1~~TRINITY_DN31308_c1_g1_i1.p1  ORF type:complete len:387 (+),score=51.92 TRINITY_DN31308_c1_g1_i1:71-1162(+)